MEYNCTTIIYTKRYAVSTSNTEEKKLFGLMMMSTFLIVSDKSAR